MKIFGLAGWSGSGKTTLLVKLIPSLIARGITVSTLKHAHHKFDIDKPGKDSHSHREAGAKEVMIAAASRWALMHELRDEEEPSLGDLIAHMSPVDLLLVEGFKFDPHDKLEVHRPSVGKALLQPDDPYICAVASDEALSDVPVPVLDIDDIDSITDFVLERTWLGGAAGQRQAGDD